MAINRNLTNKQKTLIVFALTSAILLLTVSSVFAVLYNIDTNNNSVSDWSGVPVFQSDSSGDVSSSCTGGDTRDDIIQTYVASGPAGGTPTWIYLRARMAGSNAIGVNQHWVGVFIDCAPAGEDNQDTVIFFDAQGDDVYAGDGFKTSGKYTPDNIAGCGTGETGERPSDGLDTVEWSCDWDLISSNPTGANCDAGSVAQIKFMSFKVTAGLIPEFDCMYDETTYSGFNIATNVELASFTNKNQDNNLYLILFSISALFAILLIVFLLIYLRNIKENQA